VLFGAKDEARTRDPDLGKVVLYQLSYFRIGMAKLTEIRFVQTENLNFYGKKSKHPTVLNQIMINLVAKPLLSKGV
jgi:hypothetical protein